MRNYKMILQYDGSRYQGWQRLKEADNTIQGKLEQVLTRFQEAENGARGITEKAFVEVIGSGRTDAGVHAYGQVANFYLNTEKTVEEIWQYLNHYLPDDIGVISLEEVPERFHSRFGAKSKLYCYRVINGTQPHVFDRKYTYTVPEPLDVEAMRKAAEFFVGTHDFKAFTSMKKMKKSTVRTINQLEIEVKPEVHNTREIDFYFDGNGFLYNMVRILMGTLIEVGQGKRSPDSMKELLEETEREKTGYLVPGKGLALMEVRY